MRLSLTLLATTGAILGVALTQAAPIPNALMLTRSLEPAPTLGFTNTLTARAAAAAVDAVDSVYKRQESQLDARAPMTAGQGAEVLSEATHLTSDVGAGAEAVHDADASSSLKDLGKKVVDEDHQPVDPSRQFWKPDSHYVDAKKKADESLPAYQAHKALEPSKHDHQLWQEWNEEKMKLHSKADNDRKTLSAAAKAQIARLESLSREFPNLILGKHVQGAREHVDALDDHMAQVLMPRN